MDSSDKIWRKTADYRRIFSCSSRLLESKMFIFSLQNTYFVFQNFCIQLYNRKMILLVHFITNLDPNKSAVIQMSFHLWKKISRTISTWPILHFCKTCFVVNMLVVVQLCIMKLQLRVRCKYMYSDFFVSNDCWDQEQLFIFVFTLSKIPKWWILSNILWKPISLLFIIYTCFVWQHICQYWMINRHNNEMPCMKECPNLSGAKHLPTKYQPKCSNIFLEPPWPHT